MNSSLTSYNCARKLFKTGYMSDITFYIGESKTNSTRFPAHKCFLSFASPVFSAMLEDEFTENETGDVLITDVTPLAFNALLRFIYTDEFNEKITILDYADILYAAEKYMLEPMTNYCIQKLAKRAVTLENFWAYYNIINNYFSEQMSPVWVINTLKFLSENSEELLSRDECGNLSSDIVGKIVESKAVKANSELTIINFILNWSRMECYRQKLEVTFDNTRNVLGDILYKIRFLTLSMFQLKNQSELLTVTERDEVLIPLLSKQENGVCSLSDKDSNTPNPWNKKLLAQKRNGYCNEGLRWIGEPSNPADPPCRNYKISIISAKDFIFEYVRLTSKDKLVIKGKIKKLNGEILKYFKHDFESCKTDSDVLVDVTICLKAYTVYILDMEFEHGTLSKNKYNLHYCLDNGETVIIIEELSNCEEYEFKSHEYWQSVFNGEQNVKQLDCFVKGIDVHI